MKVKHQAPSNIALVKYRGKHGTQLPNNPSISFSLNNSYSTTTVTTGDKKGNEPQITFLFEEKEAPSFISKIQKILNSAIEMFPILASYDYHIKSENSFPHSAGIASSASSMAVLAKCFCQIADIDINSVDGLEKVSHLARLGSGSACRSLYERASRGETEQGGSDLYATPLTDIHPDFHSIQDTIILIETTPKSISSTQGHACMEANPYATQRYKNACIRHTQLLTILKKGGRKAFTQIVESEALDLHAMMMTSCDYFTLLQPGTIALLHALQKFRSDTQIPFAFTIDAGPNIHLLYPPSSKIAIYEFLETEKKLYKSLINDYIISK